ncbi:hypothetical protein I316_03391 [Kwoniella heveanensis BCC8398]|uniref:BHLH domain-containing protein n=1 Tax=Kwoniella heveanensis BCC8398 TaxID=1296120 RepID=A0A1B9GUZ1_9TREE|nr:hypothetical protein I316_03391 [Kwoniella heveanensis BCC8398]
MTKDEKPVIDANGNALTGGRARSSSNASREERASPMRNPASLASSPASSLTIDVELSRKRKDREDELGSPGTPQSFTSSFLMTPQFGPTEPSSKRRSSIIEYLALNDKDLRDVKPLLSSKNDENPLAWLKNSSEGPYDLSNYPVPPQQPITVFPVQYDWNSNDQVHNGSNPQGDISGQANNNTNIDPSLSSIRSGTDAHSNGDTTTADAVNALPDLRFTDETLASATGSPSGGGLEHIKIDTPTNVGDVIAQNAQASGSNSASTSGGLLAPPDSDTPKKEQPFSRSPELRVSHKLAERKRRKEMKDLFDELREELPADRGMKASKWEILSKAIDHIRGLKDSHQTIVREIEHLRRELDIARGGSGGAYQQGGYPSYNISAAYPPYNVTPNPARQAQNQTQGQPQGQQQPQSQPQAQAQQTAAPAAPAAIPAVPQVQAQAQAQPAQPQQPAQEAQPAQQPQTLAAQVTATDGAQ